MRQVRYLNYKTTTSTWLASIPEHWEEKRLKDVATYNDESLDEKTDPDFEIEYVDISSVSLAQGIEQTELLDFEKAPSRARRKVKHGDIIISTVRTYLKAIAPIINPPHNMIVSTGFAVIRPHSRLDSRFAGYMLQSNGFVGDVVANSVGVSYPAINASDLARLPFAEPPLPEQRRISDFLDHKTAQIDALIAKKQALLEKLAEQRTALISQAVTKGLDPSVPMKNSGVEWLGEIPAHWKVIPIKFSLDMPITDGPHSTPQFYNEGIPFISAEAVKNDQLDFTKMRGYISKEDHELFSKKYKPKHGDVYMVKSGATTGAVARVETHQEFNIWSPLAVLRPHPEKSLTDYIFYILKSKPFFYSVELSWSYGTQQNIGMGVISNIRIALPPIDEQRDICKYLELHLKKIGCQRSKINSVIERLHEYRAALITNAVTGKIDVRDFRLPTTTEQRELAHG
ncbi:MAG: restriction endonuclease subunit S [Desulfovibrionales bacterium]|nr:restriction endonuclease subunit S [Desulfovibrionales bacterium]